MVRCQNNLKKKAVSGVNLKIPCRGVHERCVGYRDISLILCSFPPLATCFWYSGIFPVLLFGGGEPKNMYGKKERGKILMNFCSWQEAFMKWSTAVSEIYHETMSSFLTPQKVVWKQVDELLKRVQALLPRLDHSTIKVLWLHSWH